MCLQLHFDPFGSEYCVGSVINVTIFTNLSLTLDDNVTLLANDTECSVNDIDKDIVECAIDDSHFYSFILTATNSGTVIIKAHTDYYGADWYSDSKQVTVTEECTKGMQEISYTVGILQETVDFTISKNG